MTIRRWAVATLCTLAMVPAALGQERAAESFDSNGVRISYADTGRGAPVVLLHGFTGSYARHWERSDVSQALETAGYRVIGVSMGGAIAQQMVVKYPARVLTATLLGSGWEGEYLPALTSNMRAMAEGFDRREASGLLGAVSGSGTNGMTKAQLAAATEDLFARNDPRVLAVIARGSPPLWQVSRDDLQRVRVPMLAISGERDQSNLDGARRMVGVVPGLRVIMLPGATHQTSVRPAAPHLVAFLDQHHQ